jgi:hypothetical protein
MRLQTTHLKSEVECTQTSRMYEYTTNRKNRPSKFIRLEVKLHIMGSHLIKGLGFRQSPGRHGLERPVAPDPPFSILIVATVLPIV